MDLVELFSRVGFPVAVAAFVLFRLNGKMDNLVAAMTRLADHLEGYLDGQPKRRKSK